VSKARNLRELTAAELAEVRAKGALIALILDARPAEQFAAVHINSASCIAQHAPISLGSWFSEESSRCNSHVCCRTLALNSRTVSDSRTFGKGAKKTKNSDHEAAVLSPFDSSR
jgi:hypothetical protein